MRNATANEDKNVGRESAKGTSSKELSENRIETGSLGNK